ncbi:MAG: hypothetical protein WC538_08575 [Thermoanaerobaculia bacterium]|jgi:hypothetical protein
MNVSAEQVSLSKHLMLFLVASFAFSMKELLTTPSLAVVLILFVALSAAILSFWWGYLAIFELLDLECTNPTQDNSAPIPEKVRGWLRSQFFATMFSLSFVLLSIGVRLWQSVGSKS